MNCPNCQKSLRDSAAFCDQCGSAVQARAQQPTPSAPPSQPPADHYIGRVIDNKYEIVSKLGEGGMGAVYRARRVVIGDEVAVKILLPKYVSDAEMLERFRREARAAAQIRHANVVSIFDYGEVNAGESYAYIAMELLDGESLRELLRREGRLAPQRALRLFFAACAGVGAAHRRNVYHRDLKPDNILVVPSREEWETETVKVVDFGIAKLRDLTGPSTLTQVGAVMGTPHYMSPEQCRGERLDTRSDVYSLGVILYEMLAGAPPYIATSATGVITKHLTEPPPRLPSHLGLPLDLEETVSRALSKDPSARQQDATEFARELQAKFPWVLSPREHHAPSPLHVPVDPGKLQSGSPYAPAERSAPPGLTETRRETTPTPAPAPGNGQQQARGLAPVLQPQPSPAAPARAGWNPLLVLLLVVGGLVLGGLFTFAALWAAGIIGPGGSTNRPNANVYSSPTPTPTPTPRPTPYTTSFNNPNAISTSSSGEFAVPYPSEIPVSFPAGAVTKVTVSLSGLTHTYPGDLRVLLVGPRGHRVVLMDNVGSSHDVSNATFTFNDSAPQTLPAQDALSAGTYRPSRNTGSSLISFKGAAPGPPYSDSLSVFNNTDPNGTWRLYVMDVPDGWSGRFAGGWSLFVTVDPAATPSAPPPAAATPVPFNRNANNSNRPVDPFAARP